MFKKRILQTLDQQVESQLKGRGWDVIGVNWIFAQYALAFFAFTLISQRPGAIKSRTQDKIEQ